MKSKAGRILFGLLACLLFAATVRAANFTAAVDGNWTTPATWTFTGTDADGVPDADDAVTIAGTRAVTVTGAQSAHTVNVTSTATLTLGAGATLTSDGTAGSSLTSNGTIGGSGTLRAQGTTAINFTGGSNTAALEIIGGAATASIGTIGGSLTVFNGATLNTTNQNVTVNGDLNVNAGGAIIHNFATFRVNGANIVDNGAISGGAFLFGGTGTQNLSGAGTLTDSITINGGSTTTLTSDVTFGDGATATTLAVNTGGTLATNGNILTLNAVGVSGAGSITGTGLVRTQGATTITVNSNFTAPFEINSGTTIGAGTLGGSLTVAAGATLNTSNQNFTVNGDLTNNGTITKSSGTFRANSPNIVNNGTITGGAFTFGGAGTQNLSGAGTLTADITVLSGSTVTLTSDVTLGNGAAATTLAVNTGGTLAVGIYTLTFNRVGLSGAGAFTSAAAGKLRTQGVSSLSVGAAFTGSLEVDSGTTTASGSIGGSLAVLAGATLDTVNQNFTVSGNLTNSGTITKTSGIFTASGANLVNNGTITGGSFNFGGAGTQNLSGTGGISAAATVLSGSTLTLGSNHQLATLAVNAGGALNTSTFTLFLSGAGTPLSGSGTIANVNITYNGTAAQTVQTSASYNRLGIDNAAGVTLSAAETVNQRLILTNGAFNNGTFLTIANGTIERDNGTLTNAPALAGRVNTEYVGATNVITGFELPTGSGSIMNVTINKTAPTNTVTLSLDPFIGGALTLTSGRLVTTSSFQVVANGTVTGSASGFVIGRIFKSFAAPALFTYHVGTASGYSPVTVNIDAGTGSFTVSATNGIIPGSNLDPAKSLQRYWSLTSSGITQADITFQYPQADVPATANENLFRFTRHNSGGGNTYFTPTALDTTSNVATLNNVTQFSNWTLYDLIASAASVSLAGRVTGETGGVSNAIVNLTDAAGNVRMARTSPFGYYSFENVAAGQTYVVSVASKQYEFAPQVVTPVEDVSELNFVSIPE